LSKSVVELSAAREQAAQSGAHLKYAELTGRIETMRTVISFVQQIAQANQPQADKSPPPEIERIVKDDDDQEEAS
ncbi:hypothetical protein LCGC14_2881040, partial [marine sediment metagenome]